MIEAGFFVSAESAGFIPGDLRGRMAAAVRSQQHGDDIANLWER
jgi:hypothetical protein